MIHVPGEDLPHVSHYYREPHPHFGERVVIVGGGNSAAEAALELFRAGAHVTLVHRWPELKPTIKYWVRPDIENRIKEGSVEARFGWCVKEIRPTSIVLTRAGERLRPHRAEDMDIRGEGSASVRAGGGAPAPVEKRLRPSRAEDKQLRGEGLTSVRAGGGAPAPVEKSETASDDLEIPADAVYLLTGYRADTDLMCRAGVRLTDREGPFYNPETFETNVPNLFVAGGAIAGVDTGTIFIENGRFHGEKIIEVIANRRSSSW
jgi:thioredoxin reductase